MNKSTEKNKAKDKDQKVEEKIVKKPIKKKSKQKKLISTGIAFVNSTFNNTIISIADEQGNVVAWSSAGAKGFKGSRKSTPYAAQVAADDAGGKAYDQGLRTLSVQVSKFYQLKIQRHFHIMEQDHQKKGECNGKFKYYR